MLSDGRSIQESEESFGSARIGAVIHSYSNLIHLNYGTNYSLIGYLNIFLMSPIIPFALILHYKSTWQRKILEVHVWVCIGCHIRSNPCMAAVLVAI